MSLLLFALSVAVAEPAAPLHSTRPGAAAEAPARADSSALAQVLNPEGLMVEMALRNFTASMRTMISASDDYRILEKSYPGISEALVAAMSEAAKKDTVADMPALKQRYARFYAAHFSPDETAELIRFYSSKVGQRLVTAKYAKLDAQPVAAQFAENPDAKVSRENIRDINRTASSAIFDEISADDKAALMDFAKRPVFGKLVAARGAMEQLEADIANEPDPELDKALNAAIERVFVKFTGKPPAK